MTTVFSSLAPVEGRAALRPAVGVWLIAVALLVAAMVTLGGLTRLTGSGLSITEWHPVTGVIPPLGDSAWQAEFAKYRRIPQYALENRGMSLADFQGIYWWEWTHRLLGRIVGFVFLVPFVVFVALGAIARAKIPRMVVLFALGGLQGVVGWWMVTSGLETRVSVSQYRLAIHLGIAILLFGALLWTALEYLRRTPVPSLLHRGGKPLAWSLVALVYLQMLLGALVAGLHGGLIYNTWPSMNGRLVPEDAFASHPWWINPFENPALAQFDHRLGAYAVAILAGILWLSARRTPTSTAVRASTSAVVAVTLIQIALGIATLVNLVPIALAALHQATAVALFAAALWNAFEVSRSTYPAPSA
ncbi:MAG TPA: COX15/CtaA family protein [Rhizomicrobium sp.]|jgi:cytochrome c oxidase assembly protein subunit 15